MTVIDVIVLAFNEEDTIGATLCSLAGQSFEAGVLFRVLVVPNGCTDQTVQRAVEVIERLPGRRGMSFEIAERKEGGKHKSINFALARTGAPLVFCVDADVTFSPGCLTQVLHSFDEDRVQVSGAEPNVDINPELRGTLLGDLYRVRQLRREAVGARLTPFGNFMAFRRGVITGFPEDFAGADNSWLAFDVARRYGWEAVTVADGAEVLAIPPQDWVDFIRQESRWELNLQRLLQRRPELAPVADERDGRVMVERLFTSSRKVEVLEQMRQEGISPHILDLCEFVPQILRDNARLMGVKLAQEDGTWPPIASTRRLART